MVGTNDEGVKVFIEDSTVRVGMKYWVRLGVCNDYGFVNEARMVVNQQKGSNEFTVKMNYIGTEENISWYECGLNFDCVGLYYFCFVLSINGTLRWIKFDEKNNKPCMTDGDMPYWTVTVYEADFCVPEWAIGKIMYQIFPDRFFRSKNYNAELIENRICKKWGDVPNWEDYPLFGDSKNINNDFFMGNLKGIEEKLDYIEKLGVEILYINPICMSQSNHRYDVGDYECVDQYLGTNDDLKSLCNSAHKKGIKVVLDGVFNHTGNDSKYFNEYGNYDTVGAFQGEKSLYYAWYKRDENGENKYWWGFKNLPVCNGDNIEWQEYIYGVNGVIDKWFELGIDGLRLDVADELTDEFIENIRIAVKRNKSDGLIIGEVWENAITKEKDGIQRTYLLGKGLDTVMNYPFTNAILKYVRFGDYEYLIKTVNQILTQYPKQSVCALMNSLSTHDITRAMTTLVGDGIQDDKENLIWDVPYDRQWQFEHDTFDSNKYEKGKRMLKMAVTIQYFLPGNPCIYYGDEVGMYGYKDPFNRKCFPWENIDEELYAFFCRLGEIRKNCDFLKCADFKILEADENVLRFVRHDKEHCLEVRVERSSGKIGLCVDNNIKF